MAKTGELDRLVENLVGRGLVAPKFVGRQVGQALIDELSNLPDAIQTSQATQESERVSRLGEFKQRVAGQQRTLAGSGTAVSGGGKPARDITRPFAVGQVPNFGGSAATQLALPSSEGFSIRSFGAKDPLTELALQNTLGQIPELDTVFLGGGEFKSLGDVRNRLLTATKNPQAVSGFFG